MRRLHLVEAEPAPIPAYQREQATADEGADQGRRTVVITGHPVPARKRVPRTKKQIQARPDRIALWAVGLGLFLVFMAVATASAAPA